MKMDEVIARINVLAKKVGQLENTYIIGTDGVKRKVEKKS